MLVTERTDPARRAAQHVRLGLHPDRQRPAPLVTVHPDHVQPGETDQQVTTVAVASAREQHNVGFGIVEVLAIR